MVTSSSDQQTLHFIYYNISILPCLYAAARPFIVFTVHSTITSYISGAIQQELKTKGHSDEGVTIEGNSVTLKDTLKLASGYRVDLTMTPQYARLWVLKV